MGPCYKYKFNILLMLYYSKYTFLGRLDCNFRDVIGLSMRSNIGTNLVKITFFK